MILRHIKNLFKLFPTYKINGYDLVLYQDTLFKESLKVRGNILCRNGRHSLFVNGNIHANNIYVKHIRARNIVAGDIYADEIFCRKRLKKKPDVETIATLLVQNRFKLEHKEQMPVEKK